MLFGNMHFSHLSQMILKVGGLEISFGENINVNSNVGSDRKTLFPRSHKIRNQRDMDQQTEEEKKPRNGY